MHANLEIFVGRKSFKKIMKAYAIIISCIKIILKRLYSSKLFIQSLHDAFLENFPFKTLKFCKPLSGTHKFTKSANLINIIFLLSIKNNFSIR